jgi:serine/threonine protein kinase
VLVDEHHQPRLADFGLSVMSERSLSRDETVSHTEGAIRWMAPELLDPEPFQLEHRQRTRASDMYSFGCLCLEVHHCLLIYFL